MKMHRKTFQSEERLVMQVTSVREVKQKNTNPAQSNPVYPSGYATPHPKPTLDIDRSYQKGRKGRKRRRGEKGRKGPPWSARRKNSHKDIHPASQIGMGKKESSRKSHSEQFLVKEKKKSRYMQKTQKCTFKEKGDWGKGKRKKRKNMGKKVVCKYIPQWTVGWAKKHHMYRIAI